MKLLVFTLLFVTLSLNVLAQQPPSSPISCYVCNEVQDKDCKDPFKNNEKYLTKCGSEEAYCRKIVQTVNDVSTVIRQCAKEVSTNHAEGCYKTAGKATQNVCTCKGSSDKACNNGLKLKSSILGFVFSIFLSVVFLK